MTWIAVPSGSADHPAVPPMPAPDVTVRGKALVVPKDFAFPPVCVVTGRTDDLVEVKRTLAWHQSYIYATILLGILVYVIVSLVVRKTSKHTFFLTRTERQRRIRWGIVAWVLFLAAFGVIPVAVSTDIPALLGAMPVMLIAALVVYYRGVRLIYPERISDTSASIRGVAPEVMQLIVSRALPAVS
jgi:hypothetical protein